MKYSKGGILAHSWAENNFELHYSYFIYFQIDLDCI